MIQVGIAAVEEKYGEGARGRERCRLPIGRGRRIMARGMQHALEEWPGGFYVTNGAFKGAMLAAGFRPEDERALNWHFFLRMFTGELRSPRALHRSLGSPGEGSDVVLCAP